MGVCYHCKIGFLGLEVSSKCLQVFEKLLHVKSLKEERKHCLEFNCADRKNIFSKWRKNKSFVIKIPNEVRISRGTKAKIVAVYENDPFFIFQGLS